MLKGEISNNMLLFAAAVFCNISLRELPHAIYFNTRLGCDHTWRCSRPMSDLVAWSRNLRHCIGEKAGFDGEE